MSRCSCLATLRASFERSLERLKTDRIYGLLVHRTEDLFLPGGTQLLEAMQEFAAANRVERIGVSVYDARQIDRVLEMFRPGLVQLPLSVDANGSELYLRRLNVGSMITPIGPEYVAP